MKSRLICLLVLSLLGLGVVSASPASAATADRPWRGYAIARDGTADGGWIGGRKASRRVVYRLDPKAKPSTGGFESPRLVDRLTSSGPVDMTRWRTARAAWILSKYGAYRDDVQAAAVDVATYHLVHGGAWSLSGSETARRLRRSGHGAEIKAMAEAMLALSSSYAGPYSVRVSAPGVVHGGTVDVVVKVIARRSGKGVPHLPITVTWPGRSAVVLTTDEGGRASTQIVTTDPGDKALEVTVHRLPETRLKVRRPTTRGASRVALAGVKGTRTVVTSVPVRATPAVAVAARPEALRVGETAGTSFTVSGGVGPTSRTATVSLHGPFTTWSGATCSPETAVATATRTVTGNGTISLAPWRSTRYGLYVWKVSVAGDRLNTPTETCGAQTRVKAVPTVRILAPKHLYDLGAEPRASVQVTGLPPGYPVTATAKLFGPYPTKDDIGCGSTKKVAEQTVSVPADGSWWTNRVKLTKAGWYGWKVTLHYGYLSVTVAKPCQATGSMFKIE